MKLTKSKLKQLIKEEIKAVREGYFGRKISDDNVNIFEPSTYEGMFNSKFIDNFEDSLREFVGNYLHDENLNALEDDEIEKLKTAVMTALEKAEKAEKADPDARIMVKVALENIEVADIGDLR